MASAPDDDTPPSVPPPGDEQAALAPDGDGSRTVAPARCALVERAEVVWTVAWIASALGLLGIAATLAAALTQPSDDRSPPPRFVTDINSAPAAELALLPGIGPELANRIVADREHSGPFASAEQLARVHGIGPKTIERVLPLVVCGEAAPPPRSSTAMKD